MKEYNKNMLVGATVSNVCKMSAEELKAHGWDDNRGFNPGMEKEMAGEFFLVLTATMNRVLLFAIAMTLETHIEKSLWTQLKWTTMNSAN